MMDKILESIVAVGLSIFGIVVIIIMVIASFAVPIAIAHLIYKFALSL